MSCEEQPRPRHDHYDLVVVGSGIAGAFVARQILEANPEKGVLMLEAGPPFAHRDRRFWWDYVVTGRRPYEEWEDREEDNVSEGSTRWRFKESRLMVRGGSTVHWGGWSVRFLPEDFKLRTNTGRGADWPFEIDELLPYYRRAESSLGVSGDHAQERRRGDPYPLPAFGYTEADQVMIDAFKAHGMSDFAPMPIARWRQCMTTGTCKYCPVGARFSASYLLDHLERDTRFADFELVPNAPVSRLLMSDRGTVGGVEYIEYPRGVTRRVLADKVVVCAGSIETPKILERSISPYWPHGVANDYGLVGRYLISHPFLLARVALPENPSRWQQELDFPTLMSRDYDNEQEQPDGKLFLFKSRSRPRVKIGELMRAGIDRNGLDRALTGPMELELQGFMEEFGNYHNRVENGPGVNHVGLPQTRIGFSRNPDFDKRKDARLELMKSIVERVGGKVVKVGIRDQRGDHAASTCRMAAQPDEGVVDSDLKVFDVENLFLCSNAVFPSGAAVNPTLTLAALALRLGDRLAGMR